MPFGLKGPVMDFVFWIILIVLIVGVVWWLLNRRNASDAGSSAPLRREGGLAGGSAAASAEAAGTAGLPSAAGFGRAAEPIPPTTADDEPEVSGTPAPTAGPTAEHPGEGPETAPSTSGEADAGRAANIRQDADLVEASATPDAVDASAEPDMAATREPGASAEPAASEPSASQPPATEMPAAGTPAGSQESAGTQADDAEWETQWSEASGSTQAATSPRPTPEESTGTAGAREPEAPLSADTGYVHHHEYTAPHSPTLPGAETAAAETAEAETRATETAAAETEAPAEAGNEVWETEATGSAVAEDEMAEQQIPAEQVAAEQVAAEQAAATDYEPAPEPTGHLAADEPYGAGSASPGPDGSGPADFTVKGDAGSMVYYEEGHPDYEQAKADVWFESEAHAEAAGFRAPRRTRS